MKIKTKKNLEIFLETIPKYESPKIKLEQYPTPPSIASDILFTAHLLEDIKNKRVVDLGCGTGIFSVGAKILGAKEVIGVDIDETSLLLAKKFAKNSNLKIRYVKSDVLNFNEKCDTVFQNPPFGCRKRHADILFLKKAMELGKIIYTIHLSKTRKYIENFILNNNGRITHEKNYNLPIKHTFSFHRKEKIEEDISMFRVMSKLRNSILLV
ncbi:MAG: METTL5 family protein [Candidatus Thermoplasmatota archaeon]